jgi:predicted nucleotidyltransferase
MSDQCDFRICLPVALLETQLRGLAKTDSRVITCPAGVSVLPGGGVEVIAAQYPLPGGTSLLIF